MTATQQTMQQLSRAIRKAARKFPPDTAPALTDLHMQVKPESGELLIFNDNEEELTRCVVEQWIGSSYDLYDTAEEGLRQCLNELRKEVVDNMNITRPFSFILVDEDHKTLREIYIVDDNEATVTGGLLEDLEEDLGAFLRKLMS